MEYQKIGDKFYDFVATEYSPPFVDVTNKLKSNNILVNSFIDTKHENLYNNLTNELKHNFGVDKTCWGIKNVNGESEWELYFYSTPHEFKKLKSIINPFFDLPDFGNHIPPYMMWSFDINKSNKQNINIYLSNKSTTDYSDLFFFSGSSWKYDGHEYEYDNTYYFWKNSIKNIQIIQDKIACSPFFNSSVDIEEVLIPDFLEYYRREKTDFGIATTNKKHCDSIYYMALDIDMLIVFLYKFNYPSNQIQFLNDNKDKLNHLLYDVSINYKVIDNKIKILKSGYYGQI